MKTPCVRVHWLLHGTPAVASSRLHGYEVHQFLLDRGVESDLLMAPPLVSPDVPWDRSLHPTLCRLLAGQTAVFQKLFGPNTRHLLGAFRRAGVGTVYVHCDYQPDNRLPFLADVVVCPSHYLADFYREEGHSNVVAIDDPVEYWIERDVIGAPSAHADHLRLCWVGVDHNWHTLEPLRAVLQEAEFTDVDLITVSNHPDADIRWEMQRVPEVIASCDAGVVPVGSGPEALAKSSNRVSLFMALGKPVAAGRIPAYSEVIENGQNGYLCDAPEDWRNALRALRDPQARSAMALRAYDSASERFHMRVVGESWIKVLQAATPASRSAGREDRRSPLTDRSRWARIQAHAQLAYGRLAVERQRYPVAIDCMLDTMKHLPLAPSLIPAVLRLQRQLPRRALVRQALGRALDI